MPTEPQQRIQSPGVGQTEIEHGDVEPPAAGQRRGIGQVGSSRQRVTEVRLEVAAEQHGVGVVIFDEEYVD